MTVDLRLGDCLEVMKTLPAGSVDAVVTDPPYGVGLDYGPAFTDDQAYIRKIVPPLIEHSTRIAKVLLMPSGEFPNELWIYANYPPRWRLCWYKGAQSTLSAVGFNDWEMILVYGNNIHRHTHDYFFAPTEPAKNGHPCPKSIRWASWLICHFTKLGDTILDPFMGSGTTGVACVQTGRNFIGIEIDEGYYKIAERRIQEAQRQTVMELA